MTQLLDHIMAPEGISLALQPIFEILPEGGQRVHSLECLTRGPQGTSAENADILFSYLRLKHQEIPMDRRCVVGALETIAKLPEELTFAINIHTSTLCWDEGFVEFITQRTAQTGVDPSRLILEVIEHQPVRDSRRLVEALQRLRCLGMKIALDDIGSGHSTFKRLLDCEPDLFKIDRSVVKGCHQDDRRAAVVRAIVILAESFQAEVVAEGVENEADLKAVLDLGVSLVQGFVLARPMAPEEAGEYLGLDADVSSASSPANATDPRSGPSAGG